MASKFWRFIHMLSHIPIGFGDPLWAKKFHNWSAEKWEEVSRDAG